MKPKPFDLFEESKSKANSQPASASKKKTLIVVGDKKSGKSSVITSLLCNPSEKIPKPTQSLSFTTISRGSPKTALKIYEIGGGRNAQNLINVPLNPFDLPLTSFMIILDFGNPSQMLNSLLFWLKSIRESVERVFEFAAKNKGNGKGNEEELDKMKREFMERIEGVENKHEVLPMFVKVEIICHKFDLFEKTEV